MRRLHKRILIVVFITPIAIILIGVLVFFANFSFQKPPYPLPASPIAAYRITGEERDGALFSGDPETIRGYAIVQERQITDPQLKQDILALLNTRLTYGLEGMACFEPGIAIRLGDGPNQVDALICLECQHMYFFRNDQIGYRDISALGIERIRTMYPRLFPGHSPDGNDPDMQSAKVQRDKDREKKEADMMNALASMPTTREHN